MNPFRWISTLLCVCLLLTPLQTFAEGEDDILWRRATFEKKVFQVGQRLLQANGITENITFMVVHDQKTINASAQRNPSNVIRIYKGLLNYMESDDDLAAILSHEIVHITRRHSRKRGLKRTAAFLGILSATLAVDPEGYLAESVAESVASGETRFHLGPFEQHYETEADLIGIDYMVKAGYNPLAMEKIMQVGANDRPWTEFWATHPSGSKRLPNIRHHIATKYPQFLSPQLAQAWSQKKPTTPGKVYYQPPAQQQTEDNTPPSHDSAVADLIGNDQPDAEGASLTTTALMTDPGPDRLAMKQPPQPAPAKGQSVVKVLLDLNTEERQVIKTLSHFGYLDEGTLIATCLNEIPQEQVEAILDDLERKKLIRAVGNEPDRVYVLADWVAEELKP